MAVSESLVALLQEQLEPLGRITFRRMFSGAGVYCDGVIFALILRQALHFRVDDGNRAAYQAEGMVPFSYDAKGRIIEVSAYWRVPERLFDEADEMLAWAHASLAAGRRAAADKARKKPKIDGQPKKGRRGPTRTV
jgi:DNA transformation protein and related proteins